MGFALGIGLLTGRGSVCRSGFVEKLAWAVYGFSTLLIYLSLFCML